jgi:hypothetical protein
VVEISPFHGEGVAIEPEDVVRIDFADGLFYSVVEDWESVVDGIAWFVDGTA